MSPEETSFYLRKGEGAIYGPVDRPTLREWAAQGRVAPEDSISKDKQIWYPAPTLPDLEMHWMVDLDDGTPYGPVHILALRELNTEGALPPDARVTNRLTRTTQTLASALQDLSGDSPARVIAETPPEEKTPGPVAAPTEPPAAAEADHPAQPAIPAPGTSPQTRAEWREAAENRDQYEKDAVKWRKMYEDEHEGALHREKLLNERVDELRKTELASRLQLEQLVRKLDATEANFELFRKTLESHSSGAGAGQLASLMDAYNELSQRYDSLTQQLSSKASEIQGLLESRTLTERYAEEQVKRMEEIVKREREEADNARGRTAKIEEEHLQLVKVYREMNARFIAMRQEATGDQPAAPVEDAGQSRIRLKRSRH